MNLYNNFNIKTIPEDFLVEECTNINYSIYTNKYAILLLKKKNYSTFDAVQKIKDFFKLLSENISYAGLKDEDGITTQKCSILLSESNLNDNTLKKFNSIYCGTSSFINLTLIGYCEEPMNIGGLVGNSFKLILRNLSNDLSYKLYDIHKFAIAFPNYYDSQRFGMPNKPHVTHLVGEFLLKKNYKKAYDYYLLGNNIETDKSLSLEDKKIFFNSLDKRNLSFYLNSYASFQFNTELSKLLMNIDHSSTTICDNFEVNMPINQSKLFLYELIGKKLPITRYKIENEKIIEKISTRDIIINSYIEFNNPFEDSLNIGKKAIPVTFLLPSGCYATMLINQLDCIISNMKKSSKL